jgi:hypothetical protein
MQGAERPGALPQTRRRHHRLDRKVAGDGAENRAEQKDSLGREDGPEPGFGNALGPAPLEEEQHKRETEAEIGFLLEEAAGKAAGFR